MFYFFFLLCSTLFAGGGDSHYVTTDDSYLRREKADFQVKLPFNVSPVTGEFFQEEVDLAVSGVQPISYRRYYGNLSEGDFANGHWNVNPETLVLFNNCSNEQLPFFIGHGTYEGGFFRFETSSKRTCRISDVKGYTHNRISGGAHPKNTYVKWDRSSSEYCYSLFGEIFSGDGHIRRFKSESRGWPEPTTDPMEKRGQTNVAPPYMAQLDEEVLPNGNIIRYKYLNYHAKENKHPSYLVLREISAFDRTGRVPIGSIDISFQDATGPKNLNVKQTISISGSDGRQVRSSLKLHTVMKKDKNQNYVFDLLLSEVSTPNKPLQQYVYDSGFKNSKSVSKRLAYYKNHSAINQVITSDGVPIKVTYDQERRVKELASPAGVVSSYEYKDDHTIMTDGVGNETIYRFNQDKRITEVENAGAIQRNHWSKDGDLQRYEILDKSGQVVSSISYRYDERHNRIEETQAGHTIYRKFDDKNRLIEEKSGDRRTTYKYDHCLVEEENIYEGEKLLCYTKRKYDNAACLFHVEIFDGLSRKIVKIDNKHSCPNYGLPEVVTELDENGKQIRKICYTYTAAGQIQTQSHYDSHDQLRYVISNEYDEKERLIKTCDALKQETTFTYDKRNNLTSKTSAGHTEKRVYDTANRLIEIHDGDLVTKKEYNVVGQLTSETDPRGFTTYFAYDGCGRLSKTTYPDGSYESVEYDALGNESVKRDRKGYETKTLYNERSQPISIAYPDGSMESFSYDSQGRRVLHRDKNGTPTTYVYDALDNVIESHQADQHRYYKYAGKNLLSERDSLNVTTLYSYNILGQKIKEERGERRQLFRYDSLGRCTHEIIDDTDYLTTYDLLDRPVLKRTLVNDTVICEEHFAYDAAGNQIYVGNSKGGTTTIYNGHRQPIEVMDALGNTTTYTYKEGLQVSKTNPNGVTTWTDYDSNGWVSRISKTNLSGNTIQLCEQDYDANGNCILRRHHVFKGTTKLNEVEHCYDYGPCDRLERLLEAGEKLTLHTYDGCGRLQVILQPDGTKLHYEYDIYSRVSRYFGTDFDYMYAYDNGNNLVQVTNRYEGKKTERSYNEHNQLVFETLENGAKLCSTYNVKGQRKRLILNDNSSIEFTYLGDRLHEVIRGSHRHRYERDADGAITKCYLAENRGVLHYERDALSRPVRIWGPSLDLSYVYDKSGNILSENGKTFRYDDLDQLISEGDQTYRYDSLCNRLSDEYTVNGLNQLSTHEYDKNGNLLLKGYRYDSQNRLIEVPCTTYTYDSFHRRLSKTTDGETTYFIWDGDDEIGSFTSKINELRVLGEGLGAEIGAAILLEIGGTTYVPLHDVRGSIRKLISSWWTTSLDFDAFGVGRHDSTWTYCSKRYDRETGHLYFGRRYYVPSMGRWLTPDPKGFEDGPNLYAYVHNNPFHIDLYGLADGGFRDIFLNSIPVFGHVRLMAHYAPEDWINPANPQFFSLNDKGYDLPELPGGKNILFHNGMFGKEANSISNALYLSDLGGQCNVQCFYNPSNGVRDVARVAIERVTGREFKQVAFFQKKIENILSDPSSSVLYVVNSEAAMQANPLLKRLPQEMQDRIRVIGVAGAVPISDRHCHLAENFRAPAYRDPVPLAGASGWIRNKHSVVKLKSHPEAPRFDHYVSSPTFESHLRKIVSDYSTKGL